MTEERAEKLRELLEYQDYITEFGFSNHAQDTNLNGFRDHPNGNIADRHLSTMGHPWWLRNTAWIKVPSPKPTCRVVINRTQRYQTPWFDWGQVCDRYKESIGFIGVHDEWLEFCETYKKHIPLIQAKDFMEVARVIAGCDLYIGNPTCSTAIAEGLKHPNMIVEAPEAQEKCVRFNRKGVVYVKDGRLEFPQL
jgi:hypothetical protein